MNFSKFFIARILVTSSIKKIFRNCWWMYFIWLSLNRKVKTTIGRVMAAVFFLKSELCILSFHIWATSRAIRCSEKKWKMWEKFCWMQTNPKAFILITSILKLDNGDNVSTFLLAVVIFSTVCWGNEYFPEYYLNLLYLNISVKLYFFLSNLWWFLYINTLFDNT